MFEEYTACPLYAGCWDLEPASNRSEDGMIACPIPGSNMEFSDGL